MVLLLPAFHDLGAHFDEAVLGLAGREEADGLDGVVDVLLRQGARLFEPRAAANELSCL